MMVYFQLMYEFFKTGLFAIGGGLATIPFLYDIAEKYTWFNKKTIADMLAVSESTPGAIGVNLSTYAGYNAAGISGGVLATFALVLPSVIIIIWIAKFMEKFSNNGYVKSAFYGLRPAVVALISLAAFEVAKLSILNWDAFGNQMKLSNLFEKKEIFLFIFLFFVSKKFKFHPIFYVVFAAAAGIIFKI